MPVAFVVGAIATSSAPAPPRPGRPRPGGRRPRRPPPHPRRRLEGQRISTTQPGRLVALDPDATAADIRHHTDRYGAVVVRQVLAPALVDRINAELDPHLLDQDPTGGYSDDPERAGFYGRRTRRLQSVVTLGDAVVETIADERLLRWVSSTLTWGTEVSLNSAQVIDIGPGQPAQVLHRDEELWPEAAAAAPGDFTTSCMLALTDFTEETGATRVLPGTHRRPKQAATGYDPADTIPAVMSAGDALFFTGSVVHGGGANVTEGTWRRGIALSFIVGWMRTEEAHNLAVPLERARRLPPRVRELLSFAAYRARMGLVYQLDMQDPYVTLFGEPRPPPLRALD